MPAIVKKSCNCCCSILTIANLITLQLYELELLCSVLSFGLFFGFEPVSNTSSSSSVESKSDTAESEES